MIIATKLCTQNCSNGNPRRGWILSVVERGDDIKRRRSPWTHYTRPVAFADEGYTGAPSVTERLRGTPWERHTVVEGPHVQCTTAEYLDWLRWDERQRVEARARAAEGRHGE